MRCQNCGKKIPSTAKVCKFCEAAVEAEPTEEEKEALSDILQQMPPEAMEELLAAFAGANTAEEFADRILVGECPKCGSAGDRQLRGRSRDWGTFGRPLLSMRPTVVYRMPPLAGAEHAVLPMLGRG